jgi:eukaryotic-like serine/threonine-protein kinase
MTEPLPTEMPPEGAGATAGSDPGQAGASPGSDPGQAGASAGSDPGQAGASGGSDPGQANVGERANPEGAPAFFPVDDYVVGPLIGEGQFGEVRLATWTRRGIEVALKKVPAYASDAANKIRAEQRGAELQRRLSGRHKGLVPEVYQDGLSEAGDYYIAMERIAGRSMADVLKAAPRPSRETAQMGLALADFLSKLHALSERDNGEEPIVHSDLKPDHVLVLSDGSIRVLDLGIAKTLRANRALTVNFWASAPYASPERLEDGNVRLGDDLWAVGVMLFEMVSQEHPYQAYMVDDNNAALARAIRRSDPQGAIHRSCDGNLAAIIRKMLAPQPSHRYQTAAEVADDLTRYLNGEAPVAATESARASTPTQVIAAPAAPAPVTAPTTRDVKRPDTVPTDPLPPGLTLPPAEPVMPPSAPLGRRAQLRRLAARLPRPSSLRAGLAALLVMIIIAEGAASISTERVRQRLGAVEASDVDRLRSEVKNIESRAPFGLALRRLHRQVKERMLVIADRPIHDFRQDLFVSQLQWEQAQRCLALAAEVGADDHRVVARMALVDAHLTRITANDRGLAARERQKRLNAAMSRFTESARIDPSSPDPYLGQARINAYNLHDLEALTANIAEAEQRGYAAGRRERMQLGDIYRYRGDRLAEQGARTPLESRRRLLEQASAEYAECVTKFDGLTDYHDADKVLTHCQDRRATMQRLMRELDEVIGAGGPGLPEEIDASSHR